MPKSTKITSLAQLQREIAAGLETLEAVRKKLGEPVRYRQTKLQRYEHVTVRFGKLRRSTLPRFEHLPSPTPPPAPHTPLAALSGAFSEPENWVMRLSELVALLPPLRATASPLGYDRPLSSVPDLHAVAKAVQTIHDTWQEGMSAGGNYPNTGTLLNTGAWRGMAVMATSTGVLWSLLIDAISAVHEQYVGEADIPSALIAMQIGVIYWGTLGSITDENFDQYHSEILDYLLEEEDYDSAEIMGNIGQNLQANR